MTASAGKAAFGTVLTIGTTTIGEVTAITPPNLSANDIDMTNMSSADGYKEFIQGLRDGGEFSFEANFLTGAPAGQEALLALFHAGTVSTTYKIQFPGSLANWTFSGYVKNVSMTAPLDGKIGFAATIKITGKPVLASG